MSLKLGKLPAVLRLGKLDACYDGRDLLFSQYASKVKMPAHPKSFGHEKFVKPNAWGMLGNDVAGDCVFAGGMHETMLFTAAGGSLAKFTPANAVADYGAVTGYKPGELGSDQGTEVRYAMKYRQTTGLIDAAGVRHKIGPYVALELGNLDQVKMAIYLFGAVGLGFRFPNSAMDQYEAGRNWSVVHGSKVVGGHYVACVGFRGNYLQCVTWGRIQQVTPFFFSTFVDEAWAILSPEIFKNGKSLRGFDLATLQNDFKAIQQWKI